MIKVKWDIEEYVALIDVYDRYHSASDSEIKNALQVLSIQLHHRAEMLNIPHDEKFRNAAGMQMMYQNVVYQATHGTEGLSATSAKLTESYKLFKSNQTLFRMILEEFNRKYPRQLI